MVQLLRTARRRVPGGAFSAAGPAGFSLLAGKKQGISSVLASVIPIWHRKSLLDQWLRAKFPTHRSRELIELLQGIYSAHQGSLRLDQGRPTHRAALSKRVNELGWHIQINASAPTIMPILEKVPSPIV